jgi:hypothetical protein
VAVAGQTKPNPEVPNRSGGSQLLVPSLIAGMIALVVFAGNWLHSDVVEVRQKQEAFQQISTDLERVKWDRDHLIDELNERAKREYDVLCRIDRGHYDANGWTCKFDDGRSPLIYEQIPK